MGMVDASRILNAVSFVSLLMCSSKKAFGGLYWSLRAEHRYCDARAKRWRFCRTRMSQSTSSSTMKAVVRFWSTTLRSGLVLVLGSDRDEAVIHRCNAFICVLQLPRIPTGSFLFDSGAGYAFSLILSPVTPSMNSSLIFETAAERLMASRRSVRKGRLSTITFSNL